MADARTIGFVFIERFADWEYGLLAASAVEWFGARAVSLSPGGAPVVSTSGFRFVPDRGTDGAKTPISTRLRSSARTDGRSDTPPDVSAAAQRRRGARRRGRRHLRRHAGAGPRRPVRRTPAHTSNGRDWILGRPGYRAPSTIRTCRMQSPTATSSRRPDRHPAPSRTVPAALYPDREASSPK